MCIIVAEDEEVSRQYWLNVSKTNIFASHTKPGFQTIIYSLSIASSTQAAMILPLPVALNAGENALKFIDLSSYAEFFDDLARVCQPLYQVSDFGAGCAGDEPLNILPVYDVGDYEASYVPTMADFNRLDSRFRLADEVWEKMPDYSDYGFAVFQLKTTLSNEGETKENKIHPMAFEFQTRDSQKLFFPTVHVHDGDYHSEAGFYHTFYCQQDNAYTAFKIQRDKLMGLEPAPPTPYVENDETGIFIADDWFLTSSDVAANLMPVDRCEGLIDPDKKIYAMTLMGDYANVDLWLENDST
jgi:hypothetical protein